MGLLTRGAVLLAAAGLVAWTVWGLYIRRSTETVPYEQIRTLDGAELRQYPETVLVETSAPDQRTAFRRLFGYLKGDNDGGESVSMTAPVELHTDGSVPMTAPVQSVSEDDRVRMAFYLPASYGPETAPAPTHDEVWLRNEAAKTVAARQFSWFTPDWRVARQTQQLRTAVSAAGLETVGEPVLMRYDDPRTPPFMRRNEVVVDVSA